LLEDGLAPFSFLFFNLSIFSFLYSVLTIGKYELRQRDVEFSKYIQSKGYHIIPVPGPCQLEYGCNCLNLGGSVILSVHQRTAKAIARSPHFKGDVYYVPFNEITNM
jgi:N-dimethylarginine dimethylaminohydrolase